MTKAPWTFFRHSLVSSKVCTLPREIICHGPRRSGIWKGFGTYEKRVLFEAPTFATFRITRFPGAGGRAQPDEQHEVHENQVAGGPGQEQGDGQSKPEEHAWPVLGSEVNPDHGDTVVHKVAHDQYWQRFQLLPFGRLAESLVQRALGCCAPQHRILCDMGQQQQPQTGGSCIRQFRVLNGHIP